MIENDTATKNERTEFARNLTRFSSNKQMTLMNASLEDFKRRKTKKKLLKKAHPNVLSRVFLKLKDKS